jgi:hypothetical protein
VGRKSKPKEPAGRVPELLDLLKQETVHPNAVIIAGFRTYSELLAKPKMTKADHNRSVLAGKCIGSAVAILKKRPELMASTVGFPPMAFLTNRDNGLHAPCVFEKRNSRYERMPRPETLPEQSS